MSSDSNFPIDDPRAWVFDSRTGRWVLANEEARAAEAQRGSGSRSGDESASWEGTQSSGTSSSDDELASWEEVPSSGAYTEEDASAGYWNSWYSNALPRYQQEWLEAEANGDRSIGALSALLSFPAQERSGGENREIAYFVFGERAVIFSVIEAGSRFSESSGVDSGVLNAIKYRGFIESVPEKTGELTFLIHEYGASRPGIQDELQQAMGALGFNIELALGSPTDEVPT